MLGHAGSTGAQGAAGSPWHQLRLPVLHIRLYTSSLANSGNWLSAAQ